MVLVYFLKAQLLKCKAFRDGFMLFFCFLPPPSPLNTEATYTKGDATSVCYKVIMIFCLNISDIASPIKLFFIAPYMYVFG